MRWSALFLLLAASPAAAQHVTVDGTRFVVEGEPFHVTGANAAVMHGEAHRRAARETLEAAAADGANVVRVWALGEYPDDAPESARPYAFRVGPDGWVESSFAHLDAVLAHARDLGLRVIVVLANRWGDFGGTTQYLRWAGYAPDARSLSPLALSAFWDCGPCEEAYRAHVRRIVTRTSSVTGTAYADDPTIFAFELMNEAEAAGVHGEAAMLGWMQRQAALVRELAPRTLVSAGHIGYARLGDRDLFRRVCALDDVDYCDSHAYPLRHGRVRTPSGLARWIDDRVQLAHHVVGKPLLFGEVGVRTDRRAIRGRARAAWLRQFLTRTIVDGAAGALIWTYLPSAGERRTYGVYASGPRARQTRDLRRVLARHARRARRLSPRERNPRLGPQQGDAPIFDPTVRITRRRDPHDTWTDDTLALDPREVFRAAFEGAGTWDGDPGLPHFYGAGSGEVRYRFTAPRDAPGALVIRLHASSELPGSGAAGASPEDTSELTIAIDGAVLGAVTAPPDDGAGDVVELRVEAPALPSRRVRELTITADRGVCLYARDVEGRATGVELTWLE